MPRPRPTDVSNFALYGEPRRPIAPEFIHAERISERSSRYEWTIAPHVHPGIFQILLLEAGPSLLVTDAGQTVLTPPCLVTIPCGAVHAFRFAPGAQGWVLSVADALLGAGDLLRDGPPRCWPLEGASLAPLAGQMLALLAGEGPRGGPVATAALTLLLAATERIAGEQARPAAGPPDPRIALVRRFTALVEARLRDHPRVADLARELGTTPQTLTRACRFAVGRAPAQAIHDRLLREAMRALAFSAAGIGQVADGLGFADPAYFTRFFKARTGLSPAAFRRARAWTGAPLP